MQNITEKQLIKIFRLAKKVGSYELEITFSCEVIGLQGTHWIIGIPTIEYGYNDVLEQLKELEAGK